VLLSFTKVRPVVSIQNSPSPKTYCSPFRSPFLLSSDIILSAAHCYGVSTNQVVIGSSRRNGFSGRGVSRTVLDREKHPLYDDSTVNYDYLVMKLNAPVDLKPVELNDDMDSPLNNEALTVIGYGATSEGGSGTNVLQEATVNYIPTSTCNVNYSGEINDATMMCGGVGGGIDSCQGDSGGPIFIESGADTFKQVGIVSWGYGCARPEYPGVYSRVSGEVDWIKSKICQLSDFPPDYCDNLGGGGGGGGGEGEGEGDVQVRFDITYDAYPTETGWSLKSGQTTLISKKVGSLSTPGFVSETFGLNPGAHTFQIDDSFSDGKL
jgi:secreted trypsin-like serine protease